VPLYEYICQKCSQPFEELVSSASAKPPCPACASQRVERVLSVVSIGRGGGSASASPAPTPAGCGRCGDPRGPGACSMS
jgi:putative FmdB family regulatory protein